jgi:hypothetical protein
MEMIYQWQKQPFSGASRDLPQPISALHDREKRTLLKEVIKIFEIESGCRADFVEGAPASKRNESCSQIPNESLILSVERQRTG